ncbi:MAG: FAD-dependent monooxygenase [Legionellaceae bacterium]|nr:FAD-dependent monooxygenase [Legionellaceae bacterium]
MNADIIVGGGGIIGLTAALALAHTGLNVHVIDAGPAEAHSIAARVYTINASAQKLLKTMGVWSHINAHDYCPVQQMLIWENQAPLNFDARTIGESQLGIIISENTLKNALIARIAEIADIQIFHNQPIEAAHLTPDGVQITTASQQHHSKQLCIADGGQSTLRRLLHIPYTEKSYHQDALICVIKTEYPHQNTAYQRFHEGNILAFLPLPDPQYCSIVWSHHQASRLRDLEESDFNHRLTQISEQRLGKIQRIGPLSQYPLISRQVRQYADQHWFIVGDAAHTVHPLAGLGLNIGLEDIANFLDLLHHKGYRLGSRRFINTYQRERQFHVSRYTWMMNALYACYQPKHLLMQPLRQWGLRSVQHSTFLKRFFIRQAQGLYCE